MEVGPILTGAKRLRRKVEIRLYLESVFRLAPHRGAPMRTSRCSLGFPVLISKNSRAPCGAVRGAVFSKRGARCGAERGAVFSKLGARCGAWCY